jgi:flavin reductase (DIM6/NTAB) family NADH-FMN oxidoreductase RutF
VSQDSVIALFRRLTLGVYVIGVSDGDRRDAFTAAWLMQASARYQHEPGQRLL